MPVQVESALALKLSKFISLSAAEIKCLSRIQTPPRSVKRGQQLTREGQTGHTAFILQVGWACSYKLLPDGGRQIISFAIVRRTSQRLAARCRPFFLCADGCPRHFNRAAAYHAVRPRTSPSWSGIAMGGIARRGDGRRAPGQRRPADGARTHRAFFHGIGRKADHR